MGPWLQQLEATQGCRTQFVHCRWGLGCFAILCRVCFTTSVCQVLVRTSAASNFHSLSFIPSAHRHCYCSAALQLLCRRLLLCCLSLVLIVPRHLLFAPICSLPSVDFMYYVKAGCIRGQDDLQTYWEALSPSTFAPCMPNAAQAVSRRQGRAK